MGLIAVLLRPKRKENLDRKKMSWRKIFLFLRLWETGGCWGTWVPGTHIQNIVKFLPCPCPECVCFAKPKKGTRTGSLRRRPGICFSPGFFLAPPNNAQSKTNKTTNFPPFLAQSYLIRLFVCVPLSAPVGASAGPNCLGIQLAREVFNFFSLLFFRVTTLLSEKFSPSLNTPPSTPPSKVKSLPFLGFGGGRGGGWKKGCRSVTDWDFVSVAHTLLVSTKKWRRPARLFSCFFLNFRPRPVGPHKYWLAPILARFFVLTPHGPNNF